MKIKVWKDAAELVGILAIVCSLIFVGLQLQQDRDIALTGFWSGAVGNSAEIAALLEGNGGLWRRGLDGEALSESEIVEFNAIATAVEWHLSSEYQRARAFGDRDADAYVRDYGFAIYSYPGLRRYFRDSIDRIGFTDKGFGLSPDNGPFGTAVLKRLGDLDSESPETQPQRSYVFW